MHPHINQQASLERLQEHRHQAQFEQHLSSIRSDAHTGRNRTAWHTVLAWLLRFPNTVIAKRLIGGDARVTHPKR